MDEKYFSLNEALEDIKQELIERPDGWTCDLHSGIFNEGYYLSYTNEAEEALEDYGVFKAIKEIQTYEKDHFGEVYTDLSEPVRVANMLYYIKGKEAFDLIEDRTEIISNAWSRELEEDEKKELIKIIESLLTEMNKN